MSREKDEYFTLREKTRITILFALGVTDGHISHDEKTYPKWLHEEIQWILHRIDDFRWKRH